MANLLAVSSKDHIQSISNYIPQKIVPNKSIIPVKRLRQWNLFNAVDKAILKRISLAYVFGNLELTAIFVTEEDDVYSIGCNTKGCLGIGSITPESSLEPLKVESLCGKGIKSFTAGGQSFNNVSFCFAVTVAGQLYSWGRNDHGQLGLGHNNDTSTPTLVDMNGKGVKCVAASGYHTLLVTTCGELYGCGYNGYSQLTGSGDKNTPTHIEIPNNCKIDSIACGSYHSYSCAQGEAGEVFLWGRNDEGQLGTGNTTHMTVPTTCNVGGPVKQVACGQYHTMLLTQYGKLYAFGNNNVGQLGSGKKANSYTPVQLFPKRVVQEITISGDLSACKIDGEFYIWGTGAIPRKVLYTSFHDVFNSLGQMKMHKPITAEDKNSDEEVSLSDKLEKALYAQTEKGVGATDVEFIVEGKRVKAHKLILCLRSNYFATRLSDIWTNVKDGPIEMPDDIKVLMFWAFLHYTYTNKIYFPRYEFVNILDLMVLADSLCETQLKRKCESVLQGSINLENALMVYVAASRYNAEELKNAAFTFAVSNWAEITKKGFLQNCGLSVEDYRIFNEAFFNYN